MSTERSATCAARRRAGRVELTARCTDVITWNVNSIQTMFDTLVPHGWHYYWKSTGLHQLDDVVIDRLVDQNARASSPHSFTVLFHLGGAVVDTDPATTAYSRRSRGGVSGAADSA